MAGLEPQATAAEWHLAASAEALRIALGDDRRAAPQRAAKALALSRRALAAASGAPQIGEEPKKSPLRFRGG